MALRYSKVASSLYVYPIKTHTFNGSAQDVIVVDLTTFGQFEHAAFVFRDTDLTGTLTVVVYGNTAANGGGTDVALATMSLSSGANQELVIEVDSELIGHFEDRNSTRFKSLVLTCTGTNTDTTALTAVIHGLHQYDGRTPTDSENVT